MICFRPHEECLILICDAVIGKLLSHPICYACSQGQPLGHGPKSAGPKFAGWTRVLLGLTSAPTSDSEAAMCTQDAGGEEEEEGPGEDLTGEGASGKGSGPRDEAPAKKEKRALAWLSAMPLELLQHNLVGLTQGFMPSCRASMASRSAVAAGTAMRANHVHGVPSLSTNPNCYPTADSEFKHHLLPLPQP